jgi:ethanolamine utilization protein EutJ
VDLGTATCVIVVLDADGEPLWLDSHPSGALADGVVVDFSAAVASIRGLKERAETALGQELTSAATAFPPCVGRAESRACRFVLEGAGFADVTLCDEVSAARMTLDISDGVIVDVGGGSTGVGVFRDGELVSLDDRPGGGHHLDLIIAGALGAEVAVAEEIKRSRPDECSSILRPGFERIAESIKALSLGSEDLEVHLAGGALMFPGADRVISQYLDRPVTSYAHADLITPIGIARHAA